jgi:hypothetical protein
MREGMIDKRKREREDGRGVGDLTVASAANALTSGLQDMMLLSSTRRAAKWRGWVQQAAHGARAGGAKRVVGEA